jgi:hypothetical protein
MNPELISIGISQLLRCQDDQSTIRVEFASMRPKDDVQPTPLHPRPDPEHPWRRIQDPLPGNELEPGVDDTAEFPCLKRSVTEFLSE